MAHSDDVDNTIQGLVDGKLSSNFNILVEHRFKMTDFLLALDELLTIGNCDVPGKGKRSIVYNKGTTTISSVRLLEARVPVRDGRIIYGEYNDVEIQIRYEIERGDILELMNVSPMAKNVVSGWLKIMAALNISNYVYLCLFISFVI